MLLEKRVQRACALRFLGQAEEAAAVCILKTAAHRSHQREPAALQPRPKAPFQLASLCHLCIESLDAPSPQLETKGIMEGLAL